MAAVSEQTIAYQITVSESFDGSTLARNAVPSQLEDQFYEASQAEAGLFPVNDPGDLQLQTSRANRWITWLALRLDEPAPDGSKIEIVDNTSVPGTTIALKEIADVSGASLIYIETGFLVPQGSVLRVTGPGRGVLRYHVTFMESQKMALVASLVIVGG